MNTIFDAACWEVVWRYRGTFINGLLNTLMTAAAGLVLALLVGVVLGLFSTGESRVLRVLARVYVEFFQNTPVILQVCFLYYALAYSGVRVSVVVVGIISLGLYTGAYMA
ncbi:MAG: ABC transporter permease subunit [Clostridia bacterium]|nr:ABC transporter permease subunit [Clostridia bacterium]